MREIIFRGKRLDTGEWVEGAYLLLNGEDHRIATSCIDGDDKNLLTVCAYPVDPETIGQYTGLEDKNGVKIFEGDIVKFQDKDFCEYGCVKFGLYDNQQDQGFYISWPAEMYWRSDLGFWAVRHDRKEYLEVIGNRYDNPELLH